MSSPPSIKKYTDSLPSNLPNPTIHITSHDPATAKAVVHSSTKNPWAYFRDDTVGFNVVYTTDKFPVSLNDEIDIKAHTRTVESGTLGLVKPGGTVCRIVDFGPGNIPLMHRTQSLDYGIVLEGVVEMRLDDGSVTILNKGDIAVQRGTMHEWSNHHKNEWARMLFVLQDSEPIIVAGQRLKEDLGASHSDVPPSGNDQ